MKVRVLTLLACLVASGHAGAADGHWNFRVLLGDTEIGRHRFTLTGQGDQRTLRSEAAFTVKLLGLTVYRYHHEATEQWAGDCLTRLTAQTDDNGTPLAVAARREGSALKVKSPQGEASVDGCVMSFAYWNPAMLRQHQLLNAQSGRLETVRIKQVESVAVAAGGQSASARHYVIEGLERPLELWYSPKGDWLALESTVAGGKRLRYELQ